MDVSFELIKVAVLLGEPTRVSILWNLLDGGARPAGELAFLANVSPQSASLHLAKLVKAGMLKVTNHGRHRYYKIANSQVAHVIESMETLTPRTVINKPLPRSQMPDFRAARTCYDHLAGKLAVDIVGAMQNQGLISPGTKDFAVSDSGLRWFTEFGIDIDEIKRGRRAFARQCLDWSERQYHLAGSLGSVFLQQLLLRKWIVPHTSGRAVRVTLDGRKNLNGLFGIQA